MSTPNQLPDCVGQPVQRTRDVLSNLASESISLKINTWIEWAITAAIRDIRLLGQDLVRDLEMRVHVTRIFSRREYLSDAPLAARQQDRFKKIVWIPRKIQLPLPAEIQHRISAPTSIYEFDWTSPEGNTLVDRDQAVGFEVDACFEVRNSSDEPVKCKVLLRFNFNNCPDKIRDFNDVTVEFCGVSLPLTSYMNASAREAEKNRHQIDVTQITREFGSIRNAIAFFLQDWSTAQKQAVQKIAQRQARQRQGDERLVAAQKDVVATDRKIADIVIKECWEWAEKLLNETQWNPFFLYKYQWAEPHTGELRTAWGFTPNPTDDGFFDVYLGRLDDSITSIKLPLQATTITRRCIAHKTDIPEVLMAYPEVKILGVREFDYSSIFYNCSVDTTRLLTWGGEKDFVTLSDMHEPLRMSELLPRIPAWWIIQKMQPTDRSISLDSCKFFQVDLSLECHQSLHVSPLMVGDALSLVSVDVTLMEAASWGEEKRLQAFEWATAMHYSASDNPGELPARPDFIPDPE